MHPRGACAIGSHCEVNTVGDLDGKVVIGTVKLFKSDHCDKFKGQRQSFAGFYLMPPIFLMVKGKSPFCTWGPERSFFGLEGGNIMLRT